MRQRPNLLERYLASSTPLMQELLPLTPANIGSMCLARDQLLQLVRVQQLVRQLLNFELPLLHGAFVLLPSDAALARNTQKQLPGLGTHTVSQAAAIPWRLRQVSAVKVPVGADPAYATVLLVGGGQVAAGAVKQGPLEEVPERECLCGELAALQQSGTLPQLRVLDYAHLAWRLHVAAKLQQLSTTHTKASAKGAPAQGEASVGLGAAGGSLEALMHRQLQQLPPCKWIQTQVAHATLAGSFPRGPAVSKYHPQDSAGDPARPAGPVVSTHQPRVSKHQIPAFKHHPPPGSAAAAIAAAKAAAGNQQSHMRVPKPQQGQQQRAAQQQQPVATRAAPPINGNSNNRAAIPIPSDANTVKQHSSLKPGGNKAAPLLKPAGLSSTGDPPIPIQNSPSRSPSPKRGRSSTPTSSGLLRPLLSLSPEGQRMGGRRTRSQSPSIRSRSRTRSRSRGRTRSRSCSRRGSRSRSRNRSYSRRRSHRYSRSRSYSRSTTEEGERSPRRRRRRSYSRSRSPGRRRNRGGFSWGRIRSRSPSPAAPGPHPRPPMHPYAELLDELGHNLARNTDTAHGGRLPLAAAACSCMPPYLASLLYRNDSLVLQKVITDHLPDFGVGTDARGWLFVEALPQRRSPVPVCPFWKPGSLKGCPRKARCPDRHDLVPHPED